MTTFEVLVTEEVVATEELVGANMGRRSGGGSG